MIATLKLFKDRTPTPIQRFSSKETLLAFLSSSYGIGIDSESILSQSLYPTSLRGGTGTTLINTYIDILVTQQEVKDYLDAYSYVFVINNDNGLGSEYLFFVEKIERSMVDDELIQARFYLSLDVWDTFLMHHSQHPNVDGEVLRAHVNDIIDGKLTTKFTTNERECEVYDNQYNSDTLDSMYDTGSSTGEVNPIPNDIAYLHIAMISTQGAGYDRYDYFEGRRVNKQSFTSSLFHVVVPFKVTTFNAIWIHSDLGNFNMGTPSLNFIDDPSIVSMFITIEQPYYLKDTYINDSTGERFDLTKGQTLSALKVGSGTAVYAIQTGGLTTGSQPMGHFTYNQTFKLRRPFELRTSAEFHELAPTTYNVYVARYQAKYYSAVYNPTLFVYGDNTVVLDAMQQNIEGRDPITWQYDYDTGDLFIWETNGIVISRYTSTSRISADNSVTPYRQSNEVINLSLFKALTGSFVNLTSSLATANVPGTISSTISVPFSIAEADIQRRKPKTTKGTGYLNSMVLSATPHLVYWRYDDINATLRHDLYLYGYTTNLCISEILKNHKRKYFNYIKANDLGHIVCFDSIPSYLLEDIRNMLINGVFLWNTFDDNIFNYEVVNYPLSSGWL